MVTMEDLQ